MQDKGYNGWTNYETWAVGMFLDGNYTGEGTYREVLNMARQAVVDAEESENELSRSDALYSLEGALKDWFEESLPDLGASIAADLLGAAVSEVNWRELAESKLSEIAENES